MRKRALCCLSSKSFSSSDAELCRGAEETPGIIARPADAERGTGQTLRTGQMVGSIVTAQSVQEYGIGSEQRGRG